MSKPIVLLLIVFLAGCGASPQVRAFDREYDWSKPAGRTPVLGVQVTYPSWLTSDADRGAALATVDSYCLLLCEAYSRARGLWWGDVRIYLHEAVSEKIVSYWPPIWCYGWQLGKRVYTPWRPLKDASGKAIGIDPVDTFQVVPHELGHIIGQWEMGRNVGNDDPWWTEYNGAVAHARANVVQTVISDEAQAKALSVVYVPWTNP